MQRIHKIEMEGESNGGSALKDGVSFQVTVWTPAAVSEKPRHQPTLNITQVCASKYACVIEKKKKKKSTRKEQYICDQNSGCVLI